MPEHTQSAFVWYELMTGDLEKAVGFYGNVVGWDIRDTGMPGMRYMLFGKDGKDVGGMMSWSSMGMDKPTAWKGHIHTLDVDTETEAVVADGGTEHRPPQDIPGVGRFAVVADPQGAEYLLFQPNPTEMPARLGPHDVGAVGWHELGTTDWEFYSKHYGWTKTMAVDMGPMGTYQTFMLDDTQGGGMMNVPAKSGSPQAAKTPGPAWLFYFTVDNIQAAAQRVKDNGGSVTHGPAEVPGGSWMLQGTNPQGGGFALTAAR